jgi:hypothetical protein
MMVMAVVSAVAGVAAQQNAADAQSAANKRQEASLLAARAANSDQVGLARVQAGDAAGQKINANNQSLREAQATTIARAGPSGLSVDALLADMGNKGATYNQSVNANLERTNLQLDSQLTNVNNSTSSAFNNMKTAAPVDYLGAGLKIGSAYGSYKSPNSLGSSGTTPTVDAYSSPAPTQSSQGNSKSFLQTLVDNAPAPDSYMNLPEFKAWEAGRPK